MPGTAHEKKLSDALPNADVADLNPPEIQSFDGLTLPPPPIPGETPAAKRFRENFPPLFMNLQQPEVPGIWGSWDPSTGPQRDSGSSDWPTYDRTLVRPGEGLEADGAGQLQEQSLSGAAAKAPRKASVNDSTKAGNVASGHISDGKAMLTRIVTASAQLEVNTVSAARMSTDPQGQISVSSARD